MHIMKAMKGHSSFVPFHGAIIDDVEPRLVGFTTVFISGGSLRDNTTYTFYFTWLKRFDTGRRLT